MSPKLLSKPKSHEDRMPTTNDVHAAYNWLDAKERQRLLFAVEAESHRARNWIIFVWMLFSSVNLISRIDHSMHLTLTRAQDCQLSSSFGA